MTDSNKGRKHILALTSLDAARFLACATCVRFNLFFGGSKILSIEALGRSPLHCAAAKGHHLVATRICETKTSGRFTGERGSENGTCIGGIKQYNCLTFLMIYSMLWPLSEIVRVLLDQIQRLSPIYPNDLGKVLQQRSTGLFKVESSSRKWMLFSFDDSKGPLEVKHSQFWLRVGSECSTSAQCIQGQDDSGMLTRQEWVWSTWLGLVRGQLEEGNSVSKSMFIAFILSVFNQKTEKKKSVGLLK